MAAEYNYKYNVSLRIWNAGAFHQRITEVTGLLATDSHLKDTKHYPDGPPDWLWKHDLWELESPLPKSESWENHIQHIWEQIRPHRDFFSTIISGDVVADICLGCMTDCEAPILRVDQGALEIMRQLPLGIAFNYTPL
ncbi:DUF4279 domain-containing protein [Roseimicrobium sp. ORNL1]|uniref:DUF4279 domain-containing protein n=1 Tax=Roseimicrobium sp. ORNL1 TaxID=2711231 RepID=UPI0013E137B6|nr:DUF4279 domain-containing protein [Roseimicrobium sp. ORNL1]QIF02549.1 DUF4279 domain-containing protein [Roseimicrobium sp. ORNL1]